MGRVVEPRPFTIAEAIRRQGINIQNARGYRVLNRLYDRTTGNFKAMGWLVAVRVGNVGDVVLGLPNEAFPEFYQGRL